MATVKSSQNPVAVEPIYEFATRCQSVHLFVALENSGQESQHRMDLPRRRDRLIRASCGDPPGAP